MTHLLAAILTYVCVFTGLPAPEHAPYVVMVPHDFFVETICRGEEPCDVQGWAPGEDTAAEFPGVMPRVIYLDDRLGAALARAGTAVAAAGSLDAAPFSPEQAYAVGLLAHEATHYVQHVSGAFGPSLVADCVIHIRSETQALIVQAAWLHTRGLPFDAALAASVYRCE